MTTFITGGAGFIGSQLAARLLGQQEKVVILDNFNDYYDPKRKRANIDYLQSFTGAPENLVVIEGDIRDEALVNEICTRHSIRRLAHMAAMAGVRASTEQGRLYADVNTSATVTLLDAARKANVSVFVLGSTSSVYGNTDQVPFVETDAADRPLAPYPASKRAAELFAHSYHHLYQLNVNVVRFFNVYGPYGRPDMMPLRTIEAILNDQEITLYDGGTIKRDWTYIDDIVDGVVAALDRPLGYQIFNLGNGAPIALTDFIHIYEQLIGKSAKTRDVPAPATEPRITYCDNTRARELLGFAPKISVNDGLQNTWAWYRQYHNL